MRCFLSTDQEGTRRDESGGIAKRLRAKTGGVCGLLWIDRIYIRANNSKLALKYSIIVSEKGDKTIT